MREVKLLEPDREAFEAQKEHSLLPGGQIFTNPIRRKPWNNDTVIMRHWQFVLCWFSEIGTFLLCTGHAEDRFCSRISRRFSRRIVRAFSRAVFRSSSLFVTCSDPFR